MSVKIKSIKEHEYGISNNDDSMKYELSKKMLNDYLEHGEFREIPKEPFWKTSIEDNFDDDVNDTNPYIDEYFL